MNKENFIIRPFENRDLQRMTEIWNGIVADGNAFPQEELLTLDTAGEFFSSQTLTSVAVIESTGEIAGLYILHPNNVGRCGHICNASYAVDKRFRGLGIGKKLVEDCMSKAKDNGFRILQFNAVVATNTAARKLYESLGFEQLGTIKDGFRLGNSLYADICPYYINL